MKKGQYGARKKINKMQENFNFVVEDYNEVSRKEMIISTIISGVIFRTTNTYVKRDSLFERFYSKYNEINDENVIYYLDKYEDDINLIQKYQKLRTCFDVEKQMFHKEVFLRWSKTEDYSDMVNELKKINDILIDLIALYSYMMKFNIPSAKTDVVISKITSLLATSFDHAIGVLKGEERDLTKAEKRLEKYSTEQVFEFFIFEHVAFFENCINFIVKTETGFDENSIDDFNKKFQKTIKNSQNVKDIEDLLNEIGLKYIEDFVKQNYVHNLLNAKITEKSKENF